MIGMTTRDDQTLVWDVENRLISISDSGGTIAEFVYDGNGKRGLKTENGETILYINKYYEINLTTDVETTSYYLGGRLVAEMEDDDLRFIHQDSLGSTSLVTDSNGASLGSTTTYSYGATRNGAVPTDEKFTGQQSSGIKLRQVINRYRILFI